MLSAWAASSSSITLTTNGFAVALDMPEICKLGKSIFLYLLHKAKEIKDSGLIPTTTQYEFKKRMDGEPVLEMHTSII